MRTSKPVTGSLGKQQASIEARVASGAYESASEVVRAALRALDREEAAINEVPRAKIKEAIEDPRPSIPADQVFADLRAFHDGRGKAVKREA
ncbi:type II toxin-antitoxin system ParD family antitoxin (plasmid) [Rhizobium sp. WL3]|uniref:type II toxin-antitoxin system ParD family antitoxin n=1 Tax=Rhizobium sp. WL3 TaxID=2603277 RepID=UPI0011C1D976|nr:type II toxin-antitoxin system ParD family antitoxin [Rhizobium sp. WL3]QEE43582.1 type II toxin-antitoxin system ParD family antitoxin [Rhizobium sp. WL3]